MSIVLRDYQERALDGLRKLIQDQTRRIILVSPTGSGKTTIAGAMIQGAVRRGKRCIFLAHRIELINQCSDRLREFGIPHGVIQGRHPRTNPEHNVQVASIQTLIRRPSLAAPDLIIVDECHRSASKSYQDLLSRFENAVAIGLTATPYRLDGRPLGNWYDAMIEPASVSSLIEEGYLVRPTVYGSARVDLSGVKVTGGDYDKTQLAEAMQEVIIRGKIVENWIEKAGPDRNACTVCFAPSVRQSQVIVEKFRAADIPAAHIDSKTPKAERASILDALRSRRICVVSCVNILTEGWDLPHLECVILTRPTRSKSLYRQMVGRVMRPDPDKRFARILDHANCTRMHGFCHDPDVYSLTKGEKRPRKTAPEQDIKECKNCFSLIRRAAQICPDCGFRFAAEKVLVSTDESLVELTDIDVGKVAPGGDAFANLTDTEKSIRQQYLDVLCSECMRRKHNPKWAKVRYMKEFGVWPAWRSGVRFAKAFRDYETDWKNQQHVKTPTA